ncbi:hypothetical protein ACFRAQ_34430 [Nocardia sp. NPDC056611]|uniref:hypothetical protein n=1 Tax=Nocardia sp. NPDC056611 TaxID=3345877 RepID=UPI00366E0523
MPEPLKYQKFEIADHRPTGQTRVVSSNNGARAGERYGIAEDGYWQNGVYDNVRPAVVLELPAVEKYWDTADAEWMWRTTGDSVPSWKCTDANLDYHLRWALTVIASQIVRRESGRASEDLAALLEAATALNSLRPLADRVKAAVESGAITTQSVASNA